MGRAIADLDMLEAVDIALNDEVIIEDVSAGQTKKTTVQKLTGLPDVGWIAAGEVWSFDSWDATRRMAVINVPSDATVKYTPGNRVKFTQATGGLKFGLITYRTSTKLYVFMPIGTTFINEAITGNFWSPLDTPVGFDKDGSIWDLIMADPTNKDQISPTINQWYNMGSTQQAFGPGSWNTSAEVNLYSGSSGVPASGFITLSTGATSESDINMSGRIYTSVASNTLGLYKKTRNYKVTTNTTVYLNAKSDTSVSQLVFWGTQSSTRIITRSNYL